MKSRKSVKTITLRNNKGKIIRLKAKLTLEELIKIGFDHFDLKPISEPIPDGWFAADPK